MTRSIGLALGLLVMAGGAALGEEYSLRGADNVGGKFTARVSIQELSSDEILVRHRLQYVEGGGTEELVGRCRWKEYLGRRVFRGDLYPPAVIAAGMTGILSGGSAGDALPIAGEVDAEGRISVQIESDWLARHLTARGRVRVAPGPAPRVRSIEPTRTWPGSLVVVRWELPDGASPPPVPPRVRVAERVATVVHSGRAGLVVQLPRSLPEGQHPVTLLDGVEGGPLDVTVSVAPAEQRTGPPVLTRAVLLDGALVVFGRGVALGPQEEGRVSASAKPSTALTLLAAAPTAAAFSVRGDPRSVRLSVAGVGESNELELDGAPAD